MTYLEAKRKMRMLINEYSRRGEQIDPTSSNIMDDTNKFNDYLDIAQRVVANVVPIKGLEELTLTNELFTSVMSLQDTTNAANVGKLFYNISNNTLYRIVRNGESIRAQPLNNTIVPLTGRYEISMPNDFYKLLGVKLYKNNIERAIPSQWKDDNTLLLDQKYSGLLRIEYAKTPSYSISDNSNLEVKPSIQNAVVYYASALVLKTQDTTAYYQLMQLYEEMMLNIDTNEGSRQHKIVKVD